MAEYLLWHLLRDGLGPKGIGALNVGRATDGSTTTIVDTVFETSLKNNTWKRGTALILRDSAGAAAAPEGEFSEIASASGSTWTLIDTLTDAVTSGDRYGVLESDFGGHENLIEMASIAIQSLGDTIVVDTTTLDSADNQTEYAWAAEWQRSMPIRIDIQTNTEDANDNKWVQTHDWEVIPGAVGEAGLIIFHGQLPASRDIRVWYEGQHPDLNAFDDEISQFIDPNLARAAFTEALRGYLLSEDYTDRDLRDGYNKAAQELEDARREFKIWKPSKNPGIPTTLGNLHVSFTAGKVRLGRTTF